MTNPTIRRLWLRSLHRPVYKMRFFKSSFFFFNHHGQGQNFTIPHHYNVWENLCKHVLTDGKFLMDRFQPLSFSFAYLKLQELPFFFFIKTHCFLFISISVSVSQFFHTQTHMINIVISDSLFLFAPFINFPFNPWKRLSGLKNKAQI